MSENEKIVVGFKKYTWEIENRSKDRFCTGWSFGSLVLTVRNEESGEVRKFDFVSLRGSRDNSSVWVDNEFAQARPQKTKIPLSVVSQVIRLKDFPSTVGGWKVDLRTSA
jgi:hypothetical protein